MRKISARQQVKVNPSFKNDNQHVTVIAPVYNYLPIIAPSMVLQRHKNWVLYLIHDGPEEVPISNFIAALNDPRICYIQTERRLQQFGHPLRKWALEELKTGAWHPDSGFVVITNADNYHCPAFVDSLLNPFADDSVTMSYMSHLPHNYFGWNPLEIEPKHCKIDVCACMFRKEVVCNIGWPSMELSSDWTLIEEVMKRHGRESLRKVGGALAVHN